jgi:enoyl-CoA hydratase/carnithine racemase
MGERIVDYRLEGAVAHLTLNDPGRANVLSAEMIESLIAALADANGEADARVIVLGARGRIFSAGHDLTELRASDEREAHLRLFGRCSDLMMAIAASPKPVIAKVEGAAVAAGCQLVASCDLSYAAAGARFAVSGINLGLFCSTPSVALARRVAQGPALEMLLTGRFIDAAEAQAIGLINRAVAPDRLEEVVQEVAHAIASKPPEAVALGKALFQRQVGLPLAEAYADATQQMAANLALACAKEGIDAFLDQRSAAAKRG